MSPALTPGSPQSEHEIERLVGEINRVIQRQEPDQRRELRMFASALLDDIPTDSPASDRVTADKSERRPFGVLAGGLALLVVGAGFFLVLPPIGMTLFFLGIILVVWGFIAGWWRTSKEDALKRPP